MKHNRVVRFALGAMLFGIAVPVGWAQSAGEKEMAKQAAVWSKYGAPAQAELDALAARWKQPGAFTDRDRKWLADLGDHGWPYIPGAMQQWQDICHRADSAIPAVERKAAISRTDQTPVYWYFRNACSQAAQKMADDVRESVVAKYGAEASRQAEASKQRAVQESQARQAAALRDSAKTLREYPAHWDLVEKTDEMSSARSISVRSTQGDDAGGTAVLEVAVTCSKGSKTAGVLTTDISSFSRTGSQFSPIPLPQLALARMGDDDAREMVINSKDYRNAGTVAIDWSRWKEYAVVRIRVNLNGGPVTVRIVPYDASVRKVLESCAP